MTCHTSFVCDGCEKEFPRSELIEWGMDTHYCKQCAKSEVNEMLRTASKILPEINFDGPDGIELLNHIYCNVRSAIIDLFEMKMK